VSVPPGSSTPGGTNASSAQARRHARSYVRPDGRMTGSAISAPEIGHTNSGGTASSSAHAADRAGENGAPAADDLLDGDGEVGALLPPLRWNGSFQRLGRAAPMDRRGWGGGYI
jgi:hypothetical protein